MSATFHGLALPPSKLKRYKNMFVSRYAATPSIKQSKNPPKMLPQPYLRALIPSKASISDENIIERPKAKRKPSDRSAPSRPFSVILGGFSEKKKTQRVRKSMGKGPSKERKLALNLQ